MFPGRCVNRFLEIQGLDRAMVIASQTFTALIPLLILVAAVLPTGSEDAVAHVIINRFQLSGASADAVTSVFAHSGSGSVSLLSVLLLLYSGVSLTRRLQWMYLDAWRLHRRPGVRGSLNAAWGLAALLVEISLLYLVGTLVRTLPFDWLLGLPLSAGASLVLWTSVPYLLLDRRIPWQRLLPGGALAGLSSSLYGVATTIYMPRLMETYSERYGLFGVTIALVSWPLCISFIVVACDRRRRGVRPHSRALGAATAGMAPPARSGDACRLIPGTRRGHAGEAVVPWWRSRFARQSRRGRTMVMEPRRWLLTVLAAFTLLVSGCTGTPAGQPKAGATRSSTSVAVPALIGMPDPGSCWNVAPDHLGADDWFDDSPKVPCTREHTTQTARAFTVPEPTVAMAKSVADELLGHLRMFLGVDLDHWVPWQALVFLPSKAQIAKGASWVRCDVGIPARTQGTQQLAVTRSVEGAALDPPAALWGCTLRSPIQSAAAAVAPMRSRHRYEATGTLVRLAGLTHYPSRAQRERRALTCAGAADRWPAVSRVDRARGVGPAQRTRGRTAGRGLLGLPARRRASATTPMTSSWPRVGSR